MESHPRTIQDIPANMKKVRLPDGNIAAFPESMSNEMINKHLQKQFGDKFKDLPSPSSQTASPSQQTMQDNFLTFAAKLPHNVANARSQLLESLGNLPADITQTAAKMGILDPIFAEGNWRPKHTENTLVAGMQPTEMDKMVQSVFKNFPAMGFPQARGAGMLAGAAQRILPQVAWGLGTGESGKRGEAAKEFGGMQAAIEGLGLPFRALGYAAEKIHPEKYAGKVAEKIRTLAQEGLAKAKSYYEPVFNKYGQDVVSTKPRAYLGFYPEDTQYFKPEVNRKYRDFLAKPTVENLHELQSSMGAFPELKGMREQVKQKIQSHLSKDQQMLNSYITAGDIMREHYYPYAEGDILKNIVETQRKINKYDPNKLSKAIQESNIMTQSNKAAQDISHPMVNAGKDLMNKINQGQLYRYGIPMGASAALGNLALPGIGMAGGLGTGAVLGHVGSPAAAKLMQNPALISALQKLRSIGTGAGVAGIGYNLNNQ